MEYITEAMAPTTEYDFDLLSPEKQHIYRHIQSAHINASPDGPWFFIIARNNPYKHCVQLIGITDTSMLRPQVFALQEGEVQIGLICSEKQAIDATLQSIASEDSRFCPVADKYWNARGGSAADGGSFTFTIKDSEKGDGSKQLVCTNKFGDPVKTVSGQQHYTPEIEISVKENIKTITEGIEQNFSDVYRLNKYSLESITDWDYACLKLFCDRMILKAGQDDKSRVKAIQTLTFLNDRKYDTQHKKKSSALSIIRESLTHIFSNCPKLNQDSASAFRYIDFDSRDTLRGPRDNEKVLIINARKFPPEGDHCDARLICNAYKTGWNQFICYGYRGQRFTGCGLSKGSDQVRIDVYGSSGDYLASGIDGLEICVHDNAQDQVGQIMKRGKLVVFGDVGQTFMYGAKGGNVYVMGNAAGRPLINAVGRPRVVINGTCLDYLAESFMAGDPLNNGGFVILNGVKFDHKGRVVPLPTPYPGSNLFSLASGGAIYLRDPDKLVVQDQLNGGEFVDLTDDDWELILPYLQENETLFGISTENDLLTHKNRKKDYSQIYRKVQAVKLDILAK